MIFRGYLSINSVLQCILSSDQNHNADQADTDLFSLTQTYLTQIFPLRFRLELLENIFSLIFIQRSDLKINETTPINEQPSNRAVTSLSPTDNFLSSLQSNLTNDSFQTSTNLSIKTELSIPKVDNDLDELTDDDVSVCSSSISSVSASFHYSILRTGLIIDLQILYKLAIFLRDQLSETRTLYQKIKDKAIDRDTVDFETSLNRCFHGCSINTNEQFTARATKLNNLISETLWRYQLLNSNTVELSDQEDKTDGQENNDSLVSNSTIKDLILPVRK